MAALDGVVRRDMRQDMWQLMANHGHDSEIIAEPPTLPGGIFGYLKTFTNPEVYFLSISQNHTLERWNLNLSFFIMFV